MSMGQNEIWAISWLRAKNDKKQDHFPFPNFKSLKKESVHRHPSISAKTFPDQLKPVQTHWSRYRPIKTNPDPLKSIQRNWDPFRPMEKTHCNQSRHNEICPETLKPFQTHWVNKCGWDLMVWMGFRGCEHVWVGLDRFQLVWQVSVGLDVFRVAIWVSVDMEVFRWVWTGLRLVLTGVVSEDVDLHQLVCMGFSGKTTQHHLKPLKASQNYTKPLKTNKNHPEPSYHISRTDKNKRYKSIMNNTIWSIKFDQCNLQEPKLKTKMCLRNQTPLFSCLG